MLIVLCIVACIPLTITVGVVYGLYRIAAAGSYPSMTRMQ